MLSLQSHFEQFNTLEKIIQLPSVKISECKNLPNSSGIYFVLCDSSQLIYIGMSCDAGIKVRWRSHKLKSPLLTYPGIVDIHYFSIDRPYTRLSRFIRDLELRLIHYYKPERNIHMDKSKYVKRNS